MDKFYEQFLITSENKLFHYIGFLGKVTLASSALTVVLSMVTASIALLAMAVTLLIFTFILRYLRDRQYTEYEYIFTNGNFRIDAIYNKRNRKNLVDIEVKDFLFFTPASESAKDKSGEVIDCIPTGTVGEKYIFGFGGECTKYVYICPDKEMLRLINMYNIKGRRR